jgi:hypothetical protein
MDAFIVFFGVIFATLAICGCLLASTKPISEEGIRNFKGFFAVLAICTALVTWSCVAITQHNPKPIVTYHPLIELGDTTVFYLNTEKKPTVITDNGRFADTVTTVMRTIVYPGGWKYGMYVTEWRSVDMVKKEAIVDKMDKDVAFSTNTY